MSVTALAPVSARRRRTDAIMRGGLAVATILALIPLVLVIYYVIKKGIGAWSVDFFTTDPTGNFLGDQAASRARSSARSRSSRWPAS